MPLIPFLRFTEERVLILAFNLKKKFAGAKM